MAKVFWVLVLAAIACQARGFGLKGVKHAIYDPVSNSDDVDSSKCEDGLHSNPKNCSTFIQCSNGIKHVMPCPKGLHYNPDKEQCDSPCNAHCDKTYSCRCGWETCDSQICHLPYKAGPCNQTSERYYFDKRTAKCVNFTYGGCRGNENNFLTKKECEKTCSDSINICRLPQEKGPCKGHFKKYFFNSKTGQCEKFIYGGCQGNTNRFDSKEECEQKCLRKLHEAIDICRLTKEPGPCDGHFEKYFFNHQTGQCEKFVYGGCQGNQNKFDSREQCEQKCLRKMAPEESCTLPAEPGNCKGRMPRYFFDKSTGMCTPFVYGGCNGNANNFETKGECEGKCGDTVDVCRLAKEVGPCNAAFRRWWYNPEAKKCEQFVYGGCRGNGNNFATEDECEKRCPSSGNEDLSADDLAEAADFECAEDGLYPLEKNCSAYIQCSNGQPVVMPCPKGLHFSVKTSRCEQPCDARCDKTQACKCKWETCGKETCELPPETGSCSKFTPRYFYDKNLKHCRFFLYSGCLGNENNFVSKKECKINCEIKRAVHSGPEPECDSPPEVGPCKGSIPRYYYDKETKKCTKFTYGGCGGNGNNYENINECEAQCWKQSIALHPGAEPECESPPEVGPCKGSIPRYYYDHETKKCIKFTYGGCGGNGNNYNTINECQAQCWKHSLAGHSDIDPECDSPPEVGPCKANIPRYYYDKETKKCTKFTYGGCGGNGNNYYTSNECHAQCWRQSEDEEEDSVSLDALPEYCELEPETGPCKANITKFYYDHEEKECKEFQYGGCRGNRNSFYSKELCERRCKDKDTNKEEDKEEEDSLSSDCILCSIPDALPEYCELEPETGPCKANITKFYYDHEEKECKEFQYGGCRGNRNSFYSKELCEMRCKDKDTKEESATWDALPEYCELEPETGPCHANITKFYYDHEEGECKEFQYGGCGGNRNSFYSKELCEMKCKSKKESVEEAPEPECHSNPDIGPCKAMTSRWYFDQKTGSCKRFYYGGCYGNGNNYRTLNQCQRQCSQQSSRQLN